LVTVLRISVSTVLAIALLLLLEIDSNMFTVKT